VGKPSKARRLTAIPKPANAESITKSGRTRKGTGARNQDAAKRKRANPKRESDIRGCCSFFRRTPEEVGKRQRFDYIRTKATKGEVTVYCRVLQVTVQGYTKYVKAQEKPYKYAALLANIKKILAEDIFNQTYGKRRMYEKLQLDYACPYSYNTVQKVMRENGLLQKKHRPKGLTKADKAAQKSDNLLRRDFTANEPNKKLVTDITEYQAKDGKVYTSGIFDCYDNACLGI